jgi:hypothetical protein
MSIDNDRDDDDQDQDEGGDTPEEPTRPPGHQRKPKPNKRGAGAVDPKKFYRASGGVGTGEAEQTWNDLVAWLPTQNLSPRDVSISFHRTHPPSPNGKVFVGRVGGESITGGSELTPGQALVDYAMRFAHIGAGAQGPAAYDVYFGRKADGQSITTSSIAMPDVQTCRNIINAQDQADAGQPGVAAPRIPMPMGPPQPPWQPQPQWFPPAAGFTGYQPPQQQAPAPPDPGLMSELGYLRGALSEALNAAREGRQPNIPAPPGVAAPVINEEALAQKVTAQVLMALQTAGVFKPAVAAPPPAPVAAAPSVASPPPVQQAAGGLSGMIEKMAGRLMENIINTAGATMEKSIKQASGLGAPSVSVEAEEEPEEEKPAPRNPEDDIPWSVAAVPGATWSDGRPINYAKDKASEEISPLGVLMSNPVIAERAMDLANGLGNAMKDAIVKFTQGPQAVPARVVKEIPAGAIDGGVGSVPSSPPPPNGAAPTSGGWEAP